MADMAMTDKIKSTPAAKTELSNRFSLESTEEFMARARKTVEAVRTKSTTSSTASLRNSLASLSPTELIYWPCTLA